MDNAEIARLYRAGRSIRRLAKDFGTYERTIRRALMAEGIEIKKGYTASKPKIYPLKPKGVKPYWEPQDDAFAKAMWDAHPELAPVGKSS